MKLYEYLCANFQIRPNSFQMLMSGTTNQTETLRYSELELKEFEVLINDKLSNTRKELSYLKSSLGKKNSESAEGNGTKQLEDSADNAEKESMNQLAARLQKFTQQLEFALIRIKNGTYGLCIDTGKLIPKERLRVVPHTQHSVEAKRAKM